MNKALTYAGWIAAIGVLAIAITQFVALRNQAEIIDSLGEERVRLVNLVAELQAQSESSAEEVAGLTEQLDAAQTSVSLLNTFVDEAGEQLAVVPEILAAVPIDDDSYSDRMSANMQEVAPAMSEYMGRMMSEMSYGDFVQSLDIDAALSTQVSDIIARTWIDEMSFAFEHMDDEDFEPSGSPMFMGEENDALRDALSAVLTAEQLEQFDEYQEDLPQHMLRSSMGMQMDMFASGLTDDNRELILDVLTEEMTAAQEAQIEKITGSGTAEMDDFSGVPGMDPEAYQRTLERLAGVFDEDQQVIFERYIEMQLSMAESMQHMLVMVK